jgi:hypothetical protein
MTDLRHQQLRRHHMKLMIITATVLATLAADSASAGPLKNRWQHQQVRIGNGLVHGTLTPREAIRLERQAMQIRREARFLRSTGGHLGPYERAYLRWRLNGSSAAIHYHKHN